MESASRPVSGWEATGEMPEEMCLWYVSNSKCIVWPHPPASKTHWARLICPKLDSSFGAVHHKQTNFHSHANTRFLQEATFWEATEYSGHSLPAWRLNSCKQPKRVEAVNGRGVLYIAFFGHWNIQIVAGLAP